MKPCLLKKEQTDAEAPPEKDEKGGKHRPARDDKLDLVEVGKVAKLVRK